MFERTTYEIVIRGLATRRLLRPLLDDFACDHSTDGVTRLIGDIRDSAHLHGVVAHLTSVNAELISIAPLDSVAAMPRTIDHASTPVTTITRQERTTT